MAFGRDSHYTVTRSLLNEPWSPAQAGLFFVRPLDSLDADRTLIFSGEQGANDRIPISVGGVGLNIGCAVLAKIAKHQMHIMVMGRDEGRGHAITPRYGTQIQRHGRIDRSTQRAAILKARAAA
jgi:hypothetical protein